MRKSAVLLSVLTTAFLIGCSPQLQPTREIPIEDFFRNPQRTDYKLSPDGAYYAYVGPYRGINNIFIRKIGEDEAVRLTDASDRDITRFFWGNGTNIMYLQDNEGDENYKLYRVRIDSREITCLTDFDGVSTRVLDRLRSGHDEILISMNKRDPEVFDPYRLNIETGEMELLAENPGNFRGWMADNAGIVRIGFADGIMYRKDEESPFVEAMSLDTDDTFLPQYFTPDNNSVYAYSSIGRDRVAIVEYDLENGREVRVLFEHPEYDVFGDDERDHFRYSHEKQKLLYALYTAERRELHFFDNEIEALYRELEKEVGGYEVIFKSATDDFTRFILEVSSDRLPGAYYLYDGDSGGLELLSLAAPWLKEEEMAAMKPIRYRSRDSLTIHGYLTLPNGLVPENLPLIVHPHAGPQWRNSWGFDPKVQFLANRGYAVLQVNYRGSTGYGKDFLRGGFRQWGLKMQDDITDGVDWLIDRGIADRDRVAIFGWSYGGYATLAGITFTPQLYACGLDLWGISNYFTLYESFPRYWKPFLEQVNERWGDPVADSLQMYETSPVFHVERIQAPVFIAQGANDPRVRMSQSEQMVDELEKHGKKYEYYLIEGEGHAFSNEEKTTALMRKIEAFLSKHVPAGQHE
jgi:dipeptidyl aminopeptidase/acylaminoacyl peptidase